MYGVFSLWPPWEVYEEACGKWCVKRWLNVVFATDPLWRFHLCVHLDLGSSIYVLQLRVSNSSFDLCCKRITQEWEHLLIALNMGSFVDYPWGFLVDFENYIMLKLENTSCTWVSNPECLHNNCLRLWYQHCILKSCFLMFCSQPHCALDVVGFNGWNDFVNCLS